MSVISNSTLAGSSGQGGAGGYAIERSLRFNSGDSSFLNRTPSSAGNRKTWTFSAWIKFANVTGNSGIFECPFTGSGGTISDTFEVWYSGGIIQITDQSTYYFTSAARLRDPSAWGHLVIRVDTTLAAQADRIRLYWNGEQLVNTATSYPAQNANLGVNNSAEHRIGNWRGSTYSNLYYAEIHHVDGQSLDPTSFGEYDDSNVWQPIEYAGTYGTNGFKLDFSDTSSNAALGTDTSGNSNTWTVNNLSVAAGAGNDALRDSPVNGDSANDTGTGNQITGNYCTWNPLDQNSITLQNGNLDITGANTDRSVRGTIAIPENVKIYYEFTVTQRGGGGAQSPIVGVANELLTLTGNPDSQTSNIWSYSGSGQKVGGGSGYTSYGNSLSANDVLGVAIDRSAGRIWFSLNGTWQNSGDPTSSTDANAAFTNVSTTGTLFIFFGNNNGTPGLGILNAGQRAFAYTAPSGYKCLNTANLPDPTIADGSTAFDTKLYTGNGSTQTITGLNFSPDLLWYKSRSVAHHHGLQNTVSGVGKSLSSSTTAAEYTETTGLDSFTSDGFNLDGDGYYSINRSGHSMVAWAWDAGSSNTTIAAGGLNSSVYDQSQTFSTGLVSSTGSFYPGEPATSLFNGDISNSANPSSGGGSPLTFTPPSTLTYSSTVEIYTGASGTHSFNGGTAISHSAFTWTTIASGSGTVSSIVVTGINYPAWRAVRIDGKILVDSGITPPNFPSIASTVRANPSAGFSIVKWTGTGSAATVAHGIAAPKFIITKSLANATNWITGHDSIGWGNFLFLDTTDAQGASAAVWNNTAPDSNVFSVASSSYINPAGSDVIAYCFSPVEGYSAMGSYTGNGSTDGVFVYLGFRPAFLLVKNTASGLQWPMLDSTRFDYNGPNNPTVYTNSTGAETSNSDMYGDFLSNGFKARQTNGNWNASGATYIYYAVASHPLKSARAR
jgi:hypothetical protein